jgi:3-deoxy-D-manno-octulosonic-acid transferase
MNMPHTAVDIWLHAASAADVSASLALYERLLQQDDFDIILSCGDDVMLEHLGIAGDDYFGRIPEQWTAQKLVRDHTPKTLIWIGDKINANTILAVRTKLKQMFLANITADAIPQRRIKFIPMPLERALRSFTDVFCADAKAAARLHMLNIPDECIHPVGRLQSQTSVPPLLGDPDEFNDLKGRPMWSAVSVHRDELAAVLNAHRLIMRESHRSLLLLSPASANDEDHFWEACQEYGLTTARRLNDDMPESRTQVFLADSNDEMARWLSLSPVAFLGGSLVIGGKGSNPLPAASLGCAILYGPNIKNHLNAYSNLAGVGAARIIQDGHSLASAVLQSSAPEQAAKMGCAAWEFVTRGAEATEAIYATLTRNLRGEP